MAYVMINLPATNYSLLEKEFEEIIEIRNGANGLPSEAGAIRKTIVFSDFQKLSCQEFIKDGMINYFHYDYYDEKGNIIMKFHSEEHPENPEIQKMQHYPFHIHVKENAMDLKADKRIPYPDVLNLKELYSIMEFIVLTKRIITPFQSGRTSRKR